MLGLCKLIIDKIVVICNFIASQVVVYTILVLVALLTLSLRLHSMPFAL